MSVSAPKDEIAVDVHGHAEREGGVSPAKGTTSDGLGNRQRSARKLAPIVVVRDTREQCGWTFGGADGVHVIEACLPSGDYSFAGARGLYVVERKSVEDLASSVTWGRERFFREVERIAILRELGGASAIVVEGDVSGLEGALAGRSVQPWPIIASTLAIVAEGVPVVWAGDRATAERSALWLLRRWQARVAERSAGR